MENKKPKLKSNDESILQQNVELTSLNNQLYTEFSIEQLEQRLETKAWGCDVDCNTYVECPSNSCNVLVDTK